MKPIILLLGLCILGGHRDPALLASQDRLDPAVQSCDKDPVIRYVMNMIQLIPGGGHENTVFP